MSREQLTLTLQGGGDSGEDLEYQMTVLVGVDSTQTKDAFSISSPGTRPSDNILLGIQGMQGDLTPRFFAHDDGTDKSNGTASSVSAFGSSTVVTLEEQYEWLNRYIHAADFDAQWQLTHDTGGFFDNEEVFVERVNFPVLQQDSPKWVEVSLSLRRGGSI